MNFHCTWVLPSVMVSKPNPPRLHEEATPDPTRHMSAMGTRKRRLLKVTFTLITLKIRIAKDLASGIKPNGAAKKKHSGFHI